MDKRETVEDALDAQRRWLQIAALEPDAGHRREALALADEHGQRAIELFAAHGVDTTEQLLAATAAAEDFDASMKQIRAAVEASPEKIATLSASVMALAEAQSSWRKHPIRRLNAERQRIQLAIGERMLKIFPFLEPPAAWAVKRLNPLAKRLGL